MTNNNRLKRDHKFTSRRELLHYLRTTKAYVLLCLTDSHWVRAVKADVIEQVARLRKMDGDTITNYDGDSWRVLTNEDGDVCIFTHHI